MIVLASEKIDYVPNTEENFLETREVYAEENPKFLQAQEILLEVKRLFQLVFYVSIRDMFYHVTYRRT